VYWLGGQENGVTANHVFVSLLDYRREMESGAEVLYKMVYEANFFGDDGLPDQELQQLFQVLYQDDTERPRLCELFEMFVGDRREDENIRIMCIGDGMFMVGEQEDDTSVLPIVLTTVGAGVCCLCACCMLLVYMRSNKNNTKKSKMQIMLDVGGTGGKPMMVDVGKDGGMPMPPVPARPTTASAPPPPFTEEDHENDLPPPPQRNRNSSGSQEGKLRRFRKSGSGRRSQPPVPMPDAPPPLAPMSVESALEKQMKPGAFHMAL